MSDNEFTKITLPATGSVPPKIEERLGVAMFLLDNGQIIYEGYAIPNLVVAKHRSKPEAKDAVSKDYYVVTMRNHGFFASTKEELANMLHLAAHAYAVGAGYTSFGINMRPYNSEFNEQPLGIMSEDIIEAYLKETGYDL
jgi:hypothetical protein